MMPTSVNCLRSSNRERGYTLLEMVVVLALLAMATALAAPAGYRMIQTWRDASDVDRVMGELQALGWHARQEGRMLESPADGVLDRASAEDEPRGSLQRLAAELPEGWTLQFANPLQVQANGMCHETELALDTGTQRIDLRIMAPYCRVQRQTAISR